MLCHAVQGSSEAQTERMHALCDVIQQLQPDIIMLQVIMLSDRRLTR